MNDANDWMTTKWRPMMAITYMIICLCDFVLFPILWTVVQFWENEAANGDWLEKGKKKRYGLEQSFSSWRGT